MVRQALLLIDIQNDYFDGGDYPLVNMAGAAAKAAQVLKAAREDGITVVHVRHEFPTMEAPFFRPGTSGAQIHSLVQPTSGEHVVLKHHINAFRETELKEILDRNHIQDLVVCGAMVHVCIDAAVRSASDLGYNITVIHDACAARDAEFNNVTAPASHVHTAFMSALGFGYAKLQSADEHLAMTCAGASS